MLKVKYDSLPGKFFQKKIEKKQRQGKESLTAVSFHGFWGLNIFFQRTSDVSFIFNSINKVSCY